jgi:hypothetical protein
LGYTWTWNGVKRSQVQTSLTPEARWNATIHFDPHDHGLVLYYRAIRQRDHFFTSPRRIKSSCVHWVCSIMLFSVFRANVLLPPWNTTVTLRLSGW